MNINTVRLSHLLEIEEFVGLNYFLSHTAFVVCHKSEQIETLLGVLWYLPVNSPILVVTNCPEEAFAEIKQNLAEHLVRHTRIYLMHQKDASLAQFFYDRGVHHLLDSEGRVADGKGEGMYLGALGAVLLGYPQWVLFFDADNFAPSALLEYTIALGRLFLSAPVTSSSLGGSDAPGLDGGSQSGSDQGLHNVRICWASKPNPEQPNWSERVLGRCSSVVSPVLNVLLEDHFGLRDASLAVSNAGEQGMTIHTAQALQFSSGFSVETFQLLDFLSKAADHHTRGALLQQYQAKSPHFHEKKGDEHIKQMIAESLGSFFLFESFLSRTMRRHIWQLYQDLDLELTYPRVYPALKDLAVQADEAFMKPYQVVQEMESRYALVGEEDASCA
ncbi:MAG TPA: mannosyl-3-phosphoglycerate synthase [Ktedonobacterales bacterium]|nr:mannosyl-3-phosphoglycerate synthase [Ktedonobacterales bacterium]